MGQNGELTLSDMARVIDLTPPEHRGWRSFIELSCCSSKLNITDAVFTDIDRVVSGYTSSMYITCMDHYYFFTILIYYLIN
jgi:hypothetical protein